MSLSQRWRSEETILGKITHKYLSVALAIAGTVPELLMWFGTLPQGVVPQYFWTIGLIAGSIAKIAGKLTMKQNCEKSV